MPPKARSNGPPNRPPARRAHPRRARTLPARRKFYTTTLKRLLMHSLLHHPTHAPRAARKTLKINYPQLMTMASSAFIALGFAPPAPVRRRKLRKEDDIEEARAGVPRGSVLREEAEVPFWPLVGLEGDDQRGEEEGEIWSDDEDRGDGVARYHLLSPAAPPRRRNPRRAELIAVPEDDDEDQEMQDVDFLPDQTLGQLRHSQPQHNHSDDSRVEDDDVGTLAGEVDHAGDDFSPLAPFPQIRRRQIEAEKALPKDDDQDREMRDVVSKPNRKLRRRHISHFPSDDSRAEEDDFRTGTVAKGPGMVVLAVAEVVEVEHGMHGHDLPQPPPFPEIQRRHMDAEAEKKPAAEHGDQEMRDVDPNSEADRDQEMWDVESQPEEAQKPRLRGTQHLRSNDAEDDDFPSGTVAKDPEMKVLAGDAEVEVDHGGHELSPPAPFPGLQRRQLEAETEKKPAAEAGDQEMQDVDPDSDEMQDEQHSELEDSEDHDPTATLPPPLLWAHRNYLTHGLLLRHSAQKYMLEESLLPPSELALLPAPVPLVPYHFIVPPLPDADAPTKPNPGSLYYRVLDIRGVPSAQSINDMLQTTKLPTLAGGKVGLDASLADVAEPGGDKRGSGTRSGSAAWEPLSSEAIARYLHKHHIYTRCLRTKRIKDDFIRGLVLRNGVLHLAHTVPSPGVRKIPIGKVATIARRLNDLIRPADQDHDSTDHPDDETRDNDTRGTIGRPRHSLGLGWGVLFLLPPMTTLLHIPSPEWKSMIDRATQNPERFAQLGRLCGLLEMVWIESARVANMPPQYLRVIAGRTWSPEVPGGAPGVPVMDGLVGKVKPRHVHAAFSQFLAGEEEWRERKLAERGV